MKFTRDLTLDEERRMLLRSVTEFREQVIDGSAREMDESPSSGVIEETWMSAASPGLTSALLGEGSGGQGMDMYSFCLALSEVARGCAGFAALVLHHNLALWAMEAGGSREPGNALIGGRERATLAWPVKYQGATARAEFVPGLAAANVCVVPLPEGRLFIVARGEGATIDEIEAPLGLRASRPASLGFGPGDPVAGDLGGKMDELEGRLLLGMAALSVGIARHAFEVALEYARERYQAGEYIIGHQQVRIMLARMAVGIEAGDALLRHEAAPGGNLNLSGCRAAKSLACERAVSAALDGIQVHGGYGYMRDYGMEVLLRDAKYCQVYPMSPGEEMLELVKPAG